MSLHTKAVSMCMFQRNEDDLWEKGLAILDSPGDYSAQIIIPVDATSPTDVIQRGQINDFIIRPEKGTMTFEGE